MNQQVSERTPREEMIGILRGSFAVPVLTTLDQMGVLSGLLEQPASVDDFPQVANRRALDAMFGYLEHLGLISRQNDRRYRPTVLGKKLLRRIGGAHILGSYRSYFERLPELLASAIKPKDMTVDRTQNLLGCASLHPIKYFPTALELLHGREPVADCIDIGSGDGSWLSAVATSWPEVQVTGVDISPEAFGPGWAALQQRLPAGRSHHVLANGRNVTEWSRALPRANGRRLISCWFLIHEICQGKVEEAAQFLAELHLHDPQAEVLIGEIVAVNSAVLTHTRHQSIMPEFLLFHALSGQTPLSREQWLAVREEIPYRLAAERQFDPVAHGPGEVEASAFIWHLVPAA
jgi:hypothetical protein